MAATVAAPDTRTRAAPWYIWCSVLAVTSAMVGAHWDISWHRSIGRDTFWTPAHIAIYLCGVLAGAWTAYLILRTTFGRLDVPAVRLWGFRGPLGAFLAAWGGIAMLTSAPFDDWWHSAYGLDVKIVSPPHIVLILGVAVVQAGTLVLIRSQVRGRASWLFEYVGAMILVLAMVLILEYTGRSQMHQGWFYRIVATFVPGILAAVAAGSERRWAATVVAGVYSLFLMGAIWMLPLFPAEPKLGPVYQQVTHFIPPDFPLLLIAPALALDLLRARTRAWSAWRRAAVSGALFVGVFAAVQWPFAEFLMSPGARNWFFGAHYLQYNAHPRAYYVRNLFLPAQPAAAFWRELALAVAIAILTTRLGIAWGAWIRRLRR